MRQRKIKDAKEKLSSSPNFVTEPNANKGKWQKLFNNDKPIHIEIGSGKGIFIHTLASLNPDINYIAIEKYDSILLRLKEKLDEKPLANIKLVIMDATTLNDVFAPKEVDKIYLNFSDPWPKKHHAKRRLTSPSFLKMYDDILKEDGIIVFKTDNRGLFEYSLESFNNYGYVMYDISLDLHNDERYPDNIKTEYEAKWEDKGPIYLLNAKRKSQ